MEMILETPVGVEEESKVEILGDMKGNKYGSETPITDHDSLKPIFALRKDFSASKQEDDELECTKAEIGVVREENERLKAVLTRIMKDYQSLQMQFFGIVQQEQAKKRAENPSNPLVIEDPHELTSLSLGSCMPNEHKKEEKANSNSEGGEDIDQMNRSQLLSLGLDLKVESSPLASLSAENDSEETKEEEVGKPWPPNKTAKILRHGDHDEVAPQTTHAKKTRVSVRARCDGPTMNDGCQWRKYGQKVSKGNPCPRAYYRCTIVPTCPVRKQVQRCAEDMSILITTYEGTHNHPLPISATAMASTTSAAAAMITSGSSTSRLPLSSTTSTSTSSAAAANLHILNFPALLTNSRPNQFYQPNQPMPPSINTHPTITLDLTNHTSNAIRSYSPYTNLNFSSGSNSTTSPIPWTSNGPVLSYEPKPYNKNIVDNHANSSTFSAPAKHSPLTDTIAKAITSDPSFHSALAAAITSYVGVRGSRDLQQGSRLHVSSSKSSGSTSPSNDREQQLI